MGALCCARVSGSRERAQIIFRVAQTFRPASWLLRGFAFAICTSDLTARMFRLLIFSLKGGGCHLVPEIQICRARTKVSRKSASPWRR